MANNTKRVYYVQTTLDTVPASTSTAVTITAAVDQDRFSLSAEITDDFGKNSWIWDTANNVLYKVLEMYSPTTGRIQGTFEDALTTGAMDYIKTQDQKVVRLSVKANADTDIYENGAAQVLLAGDVINDDATGIIAKFTGRMCDPILADGTAGALAVLYIKA